MNLKQNFRSALTQVSDTALDKVGDVRFDQDGKRYKYVQYKVGSGTVAAVANQFCYYLKTNYLTLKRVTSDLSDAAGVAAGMLLSAPTDGQFCWIQTGGEFTSALAFTSGTADGDNLTPVGAADGALGAVVMTVSGSNVVAEGQHFCGVCIDATGKIGNLTCPW